MAAEDRAVWAQLWPWWRELLRVVRSVEGATIFGLDLSAVGGPLPSARVVGADDHANEQRPEATNYLPNHLKTAVHGMTKKRGTYHQSIFTRWRIRKAISSN